MSNRVHSIVMANRWNSIAARLFAAALIAVVGAGACAPHAVTVGQPAASPVKGSLLIVGGGPIPREVNQRFVDLAGGKGKALIVVFPMATAVADGGPAKAEELRSLGARAFVVNVSRATADADSIVSRLDSATGIWFVGGDQNRITAAIAGTRTAAAIRARFAAGAVVGGTSAGAAVMSETMITGDERRLGGRRPPSDSSQAFMTIDRDNIVTTPGLGLISGAIVDQHFVRRRRHNRLLSLVLESPTTVGVGVDESTALIVRPDGMWEIIGESVAVIYDARRGKITPAGTVLGASDLRMHVLPTGSRYDPKSGRVLELGAPPGR